MQWHRVNIPILKKRNKDISRNDWVKVRQKFTRTTHETSGSISDIWRSLWDHLGFVGFEKLQPFSSACSTCNLFLGPTELHTCTFLWWIPHLQCPLQLKLHLQLHATATPDMFAGVLTLPQPSWPQQLSGTVV